MRQKTVLLNYKFVTVIMLFLLAPVVMAVTPDADNLAPAKTKPVVVKKIDQKARMIEVFKREKICKLAYELIGNTSYWPGGDDPQTGVDCSGFTQWVYKHGAGINIPKACREQYAKSRKILSSKIQKGDLVFFSTTGPGATHVGIYFGNGKFIHSPSLGKDVQMEAISKSYWARRFIGAATFF